MLESVQEKYTPTENVAVPPDFDRSAIGFNALYVLLGILSTPSPPDSPGPKHGREQFFLRFDSELTFKRGCINIIVGPTGSGKVSDYFLKYANEPIVRLDIHSHGASGRDVLQARRDWILV